MAAVWGLANNKGGSNKTSQVLAMAIYIACQGTNPDPRINEPETVAVLDMDESTDLTYRVARFMENQGDQNLIDRVHKNPFGSSIYRFLLSPEDGIQEYAAILDINDTIEALPGVERNYAISQINPQTIVAETKANYLPHGKKAAPIIVIPGYGSMEALATQLQVKAKSDPSYRVYHILKNAISTVNKKRVTDGYKPINNWLIDFPGSSGFWVKVIGHACDFVLFPFRMGMPYLAGSMASIADLDTVQATNNGKPEFLAAVACQYKPQTEYQQRKWIETKAMPKYQAAGIPVSDIRIPYDIDIEQADLAGALGWEYAPNGPAHMEGYRQQYMWLRTTGRLR